MMVWARRHRFSVSLAAAFIALHTAAYGFSAVRNPYSEAIFPPCIFLHYLGIQCPGCGGTRSMFSLLHGDVATSIATNPIVVAGYLALAISLIGVLAGRHGRNKTSQALYWIAGAVAMGAILWSGVIRNLLS